MFFKQLDGDSLVRLPNGFATSVLSTINDYQELIATGYDFSSYPKHENIEVALNGGACLICIFKEKILAHSTWIAFDRSQANYDSLFLPGRVGQPSDAFMGPCNTYIPFRGLGLYPAALIIACNYIKKKGMSRALINTKVNNQKSVKGIKKAGFEILEKVHILHIFGQEFALIKIPSWLMFK